METGSFNTLLLLDSIQFPKLKNNAPLVLNYSHDKNLFQFAHEALRRGHTVYVGSAQAPDDEDFRIRVIASYPTYKGEPESIAPEKFDFVVSVFPDALNVREMFANAKIVSIMPALHWIEDPGLFDQHYLRRVITAARYHVDYYITQNTRMKQVLFAILHLLARFPYEDRILVAPQGIVDELKRQQPDKQALRETLGLGADDIMIVNSGGIWKWTDFNTFFEAFCEFTVENPSHRLRLFIMGIVQSFNRDHDEYVAEFKKLLDKYRDRLADHIVVFEDWDEGGKYVQDYTAIADIGINVSQDTLEAWQSYRMRFLDYMYYGIPVINTIGDEFSKSNPEALFLCTPGEKASYKQIFQTVSELPQVVREKSAIMSDLANEFDSRNTYGRVISELERLPRRPELDFIEWDSSIADMDSAPRPMSLPIATLPTSGDVREKGWLKRTVGRLTGGRKRRKLREQKLLQQQTEIRDQFFMHQSEMRDMITGVTRSQAAIARSLLRMSRADDNNTDVADGKSDERS